MQNPESALEVAEKIVAIIEQHGVKAVVIGAVALASYNYIRLTEDIDLGVNVEPIILRKIEESIKKAGFETELREADDNDPLGDVIDVTGQFGLVQVINFGGRFPAVIDDALKNATLFLREGSSLKIVPIEQLVALKLYAGGYNRKQTLQNSSQEIQMQILIKYPKYAKVIGLKGLMKSSSKDRKILSDRVPGRKYSRKYSLNPVILETLRSLRLQ